MELAKEMYYNELEQKNHIVSRLSLLSGLMAVLVGAIAFYISNFDSVRVISLSGKIFYFTFGVFVIVLIVAIYYLAEALQGIKKKYKYAYLPTPEDTYRYFQQLEDRYSNYVQKNEIVNDKWEKFLCDSYMQAANHNMQLNFRKISNLHRAGMFFIISIIVGGLTIIPFTIAEEKPPQKVKIVNINELKKKEVNIMKGDNNSDDKETSGKDEPIPPQLQYIWEGASQDPPKEKRTEKQ